MGEFHVIDVEDNLSNGMQAMAIAPVIDGKVDYSQIAIAYAGTNFSDGKDRQTDNDSVISGHNYFEVEHDLPVDSQIDTALAFAEQIKTQYPNAKIETTGHSLGRFLATIVSIKNKWEMTAFNALSAHKFLTESEKQWAMENRHLLVNYRNSSDGGGNFGGNLLGVARNVFSYHDNFIDRNIYK